MTLDEVNSLIVTPVQFALDWVDSRYGSSKADPLLLAIGLTESNFTTRLQKPVAHARGFWQFEKNGGCAEFEQSPKLAPFRKIAKGWGFATDRTSTWTAIGVGADHLACLMARAILWLDPAPLPAVGDIDGSYDYYIRRWRPGKPSKSRFVASYKKVIET